ncbi:hypothetical protein BpHYR1_035299 [Brachionus plicatilis]|uniref:Uncharacterized protein n=1 Tax=Brachionus plicatilis TaxID=10195 RepID=A0A3M7P138_BRAPC|nr:hypothetical protein BpHYR1_035299 [Brachionus plicatilis]
MSYEKPKGLKSKLDLIWNELQTQLPSINLNNENEDDLDYNDHVSLEQFQNFENDEIIKNKDDKFMDDQFLEFDKASASDVYLNEVEDANTQIQSFNKMKTSNLKLISNSKESSEKATKIAQGIFENTNPKLNMDIFNSINIDDLLNSVDKNSVKKSIQKNSSSQTTLPIVDEQNIIKKLAELSTKYSEDNSLSNLNLKTGAAPLDEFSTQINKNEISSIDCSKIDDIITSDLKKFLKSHKIRDGNLVETRRIDLRASQNMAPNTRIRVYSKPKAEQLFAEILNDDSVYPNFKNGDKFKFINDSVTSSSESDDESDPTDCNTLWFERYRQQRILNSEKKS